MASILKAGGGKFPLYSSYLPQPWEEFECRSAGKTLKRKAELSNEEKLQYKLVTPAGWREHHGMRWIAILHAML
jgi:hypothetical protein